MKAFVVLATVLAAASANPQLILGNHLISGAIPHTVATPVVSQAIVAPLATKTQYHAQDELGQASYGYAHPGQAHAAVRDAAGNVRGSYAYVNPEGKEVRVEYTAGHGGFRVASNALPVGPVASPALAAPVVAGVAETPEVAQARAAHALAHAEALARAGRKKRAVLTSAVIPTTHALGYSSLLAHPYTSLASPLVYSSPVVAAPAPVIATNVREATLTRVVNTPGHAVSYRVD